MDTRNFLRDDKTPKNIKIDISTENSILHNHIDIFL